MLVLVGAFTGASIIFGEFFGMVDFTKPMTICTILTLAASAALMIGLSMLSHRIAARLRERKQLGKIQQ